MLREDPTFAMAGCYASLSTFGSLSLPSLSIASSSLASVLLRAYKRPAGKDGRGFLSCHYHVTDERVGSVLALPRPHLRGGQVHLG